MKYNNICILVFSERCDPDNIANAVVDKIKAIYDTDCGILSNYVVSVNTNERREIKSEAFGQKYKERILSFGPKNKFLFAFICL